MSSDISSDELPPLPAPLGRGVKGAVVYTDAAIADPRVLLNAKLIRNTSSSLVRNSFQDVLDRGSDEFITDAIVMMFHARDIRGGKGERDLFQAMFEQLHTCHRELAEMLLELVPEYGSWFDVFNQAHTYTDFEECVFKLMDAQLKRDEKAVAEDASGARISLMAKWAPREGKKMWRLAKNYVCWAAKQAAAAAGTPEKKIPKFSTLMSTYRRRLAALNAHLKTVETFECAGQWDKIEPRRVPARARRIKSAAYLNEVLKGRSKGLSGDKLLRCPADAKRMACRENFKAFFEAAAKGEVKISGANTLYPHELVRAVWEELKDDGTGVLNPELENEMNAVWERMVEAAKAGGGLGNSVFMCDFSGSMMSAGGDHSNDTPFMVSVAMGLLGAAVNEGPFAGQFLSFDSDPRWIVIPERAKTFVEKLRVVKASQEMAMGLSTNFEAAANRLVETLKQHRVPAGKAPKNLIVVTDMGFDMASVHPGDRTFSRSIHADVLYEKQKATHIQLFQQAFRKAGEEFLGDANAWEPPRIVIWNVSASFTTDNHQAKDNEKGVLTLSGWSPALFKILCQEGPRATTPLEGVKAMIEDTRYDPVREKVREWLQGGWRTVL